MKKIVTSLFFFFVAFNAFSYSISDYELKNCRQCVIKNPTTGECLIYNGDPICEAAKAAAKAFIYSCVIQENEVKDVSEECRRCIKDEMNKAYLESEDTCVKSCGEWSYELSNYLDSCRRRLRLL